MTMPNIIKTQTFCYKNYTHLDKEELRQIWEERNHPEIRKYMENDKVFSFESHLEYVESLKSRKDRVYYGVFQDGKLIASQCFTDINYMAKSAEHGIYLFANLLGGVRKPLKIRAL